MTTQTAEKCGQRSADPAAEDRPSFDRSKAVPMDVLRREGLDLLKNGVPYVLDKIIPDFGMLGFLVGGAKVGKTSFGVRLVASIARGEQAFVGHHVQKRRVGMIALEDPRQYLSWLIAAATRGGEDCVVYPDTLILDPKTLSDLRTWVRDEHFGLLYVATFFNAVRGLLENENDNAKMVVVVNSLKRFARDIEIPVLIEAHSGKYEDLAEDADPLKALRGASAAAAEADYCLSLRRSKGAFSSVRTLSGLGRFVNFAPIRFEYSAAGELVVGSDAGAAADADYRCLVDDGAVASERRSAGEIARRAGWCTDDDTGEKAARTRVAKALAGRPDVLATKSGGTGRGKRVTYALQSPVALDQAA